MCIYHIFFIHLYVDGHLGFFHVLCVLNHFSHVHLYVTVQTTASQAPLSMGFSRQEYWSGLLCPSPGDLLNPGIEPTSPVFLSSQVDSLSSEPSVSATVSTAAMNIGMHVSFIFRVLVFSGYTSRSGFAGSYSKLLLFKCFYRRGI